MAIFNEKSKKFVSHLQNLLSKYDIYRCGKFLQVFFGQKFCPQKHFTQRINLGEGTATKKKDSYNLKQGSPENDGRPDVYDHLKFKLIFNCCYTNCCYPNCSHLNLPKFT